MENEKDNLVCQSCGMSMKEARDFGSNEDGGKNEEYCRHCFRAGNFTDNVGMEKFIDHQVELAINRFGMSEEEARKKTESTIPNLKRWSLVKMPNKIIVSVLIMSVLIGLIFGLATYLIKGGDSSSSSRATSSAALIPIWVAVFIPIIAARHKKGKYTNDVLRKKMIALALLLGVVFLAGVFYFIALNK